MIIKTHKLINQKLCGVPKIIEDDSYCEVELLTDREMIVDETGLVHGGFIFGAADYCAMLSVNHPNVVLASAEVSFLKPTKAGEKLIFKGSVYFKDGKKRKVKVEGINESGEVVFKGDFFCVIPSKHVLGG